MKSPALVILIAMFLGLGAVRVDASEAAGISLAIGLLLPPEETEGTSLQRGIQLGLDEVNREQVAPISLKVRGRSGQWGDDGEEAGRMVLDDGVEGLIAPPGGSPSHLALQVAGRTGVPVITLCPDASVTGAGIPWMVQIVPSTATEAQLLFSSSLTHCSRRIIRWSAVVSEGRVGRETTRDLLRAATNTGSQLAPPFQAQNEEEGISEVVSRITATEPDGILLWLDPTLAGRLARTLREAGYAGLLAGPSRLRTSSFTSEAGVALEGFILPRPITDKSSRMVADRFQASYRNRFSTEPGMTAHLAYDAVLVLADLLRKSRDQPLRLQFPITGRLPGASGNLEFDGHGQRIVRLELCQFREQNVVPISANLTDPLSP